jgi:hypothetical protein
MESYFSLSCTVMYSATGKVFLAYEFKGHVSTTETLFLKLHIS